MINTRTIGVLVLSIVFLLCIPVHIFSETLSSNHATMHHVDTGAVATVFSHFNDMMNAPWVAFLISISSALVLWFAVQKVFVLLTPLSPTHPSSREKYDIHSGGIFRWLMLHHTSPPRIA